MVNTDQRKLILNLSLGRISKDEFLKKFSANVETIKSYLTQELEHVLLSRDSDNVEYLLLIGFQFGFPESCAEALCKLVVERWHRQHENIAIALKELKYPGAVDCLYQAALTDFPYLSYDESFALGVKCIFTLHAIGTDYAKEKLALLAQVENEILAKNAERLLNAM